MKKNLVFHSNIKFNVDKYVITKFIISILNNQFFYYLEMLNIIFDITQGYYYF